MGMKRVTEIVQAEAESIEEDDLVHSEEVVVTVSHRGYIKRAPLSSWRAQQHGGKGRAGMLVKDADFVTRIFLVNTRDQILFFSSLGKVYQMKAWRLPQGQPKTRGKAMVNLLPLGKTEQITSIVSISAEAGEAADENRFVIFATHKGYVRRNRLADFENINRAGKIAMKLERGDRIVSVVMCHSGDDVMLTTREGMCVRFPVEEVRVFTSRMSLGVRGMSLSPGDEVISMSLMAHVDATPGERTAYLRRASALRRKEDPDEPPEKEEKEEKEEESESEVKLSDKRYQELRKAEEFVLTMSARGYGKRSSSYAYRTTRRGGKGLVAMKIGSRNGELMASFPVKDRDQIMLITEEGQAIRCPVKNVRVASRTTQGVKIFDTKDKVVSAARVEDSDDAVMSNGKLV